ncbi:MAG: hypothetical protein K8R88_14840 [Armatimonadetes bacterium]|nr:hypothetical protein [Armatimonadota bacterium]
MNTYEIWVNLAPGVNDLEFAKSVQGYMNWCLTNDLLIQYRLRRRKFGFGPEALGEFNISMDFRDLTQMDEAFLQAATRSGELEQLHRAVYSSVRDFKSGLFRDFPDDVRGRV